MTRDDDDDGWDHDRESMIHSLATRQADKDNRIELIGLNEFTKVADAVQELRNMADRELASDARKAHADVIEACKALLEVNDAVKELQAIIEEQKAEIKRLRAERDEAKGTITRMRDGFEGCCPLCETVGLINVKLLAERDEARREVCRLMSMFNAENSVEIAASRSWDCFKEETP